MNTLKEISSKEKEVQQRSVNVNAEHIKTVPARPAQVPAYAKQTQLHALEEISILTWPFFGVTNAWVVNIGNVACTIMTYLTNPEYRTIVPGENVRFQIAGEGAFWIFKNTSQHKTKGEMPLIRLFTW